MLEGSMNERMQGTYWHLCYLFLLKAQYQTPKTKSKVTQSNGLISGICLYLNKRDSALYSYNCSGFLSGCPNTSYISDSLFESMHEIIRW